MEKPARKARKQRAPEESRLQPLYTIDEVVKATRRSRASVYRDIAEKRLAVVKICGSTRITDDSYRRYIGAA